MIIVPLEKWECKYFVYFPNKVYYTEITIYSRFREKGGKQHENGKQGTDKRYQQPSDFGNHSPGGKDFPGGAGRGRGLRPLAALQNALDLLKQRHPRLPGVVAHGDGLVAHGADQNGVARRGDGVEGVQPQGDQVVLCPKVGHAELTGGQQPPAGKGQRDVFVADSADVAGVGAERQENFFARVQVLLDQIKR